MGKTQTKIREGRQNHFRKGGLGMSRIVKIGIVLITLMGLLGTAHATTLSYNATGDDEFAMYISTDPLVQGTLIASGNDWKNPVSGSVTLTPGVTQYLQVIGFNPVGYQAAFLGDFTTNDANFHFANGTQYLLTNATQWFVSATGFNSGTNAAYSYGFNGSTYPYNAWWNVPNNTSSIDENAEWIWTYIPNWLDLPGGPNNTPVYFSTPIYSSVVPIPGTLTLLGSGILGLTGWRMFRKG